jgi:hypothetical protein
MSLLNAVDVNDLRQAIKTAEMTIQRQNNGST